MYEIYFCDTGKVKYWSREKCIKHFGRYEFAEIEAGYFPHIVATPIDGNAEGSIDYFDNRFED